MSLTLLASARAGRPKRAPRDRGPGTMSSNHVMSLRIVCCQRADGVLVMYPGRVCYLVVQTSCLEEDCMRLQRAPRLVAGGWPEC